MTIKLYTKGGDKGRTSLIGGERVAKSDPRVEAYGTLDELTSHIGYLRDMYLQDTEWSAQVLEIMSRLMDCGAIVATPTCGITKAKLTEESIDNIEGWIDAISDTLPALENFTLPTGCPSMSYANVCRTICRRAERAIVRLGIDESLDLTARYVNRLSDYLYALGRALTIKDGAIETLWIA